MGFEYNIRFEIPDGYNFEEFRKSLDNPTDRNGWEAFTLQLTRSGFYFCDNSKSVSSSVAFRRIVDEALRRAGIIAIEEA